MILEVAVKKCGGPEGFKNASQRGDILKTRSKNDKHDLFFFPEDRAANVTCSSCQLPRAICQATPTEEHSPRPCTTHLVNLFCFV
jgi:hypothetical protein